MKPVPPDLRAGRMRTRGAGCRSPRTRCTGGRACCRRGRVDGMVVEGLVFDVGAGRGIAVGTWGHGQIYNVSLTKDEMFQAITTQRVRLIDRLAGFTAEDWNTPSLCAGWKARDVVRHLVSILEVPMPKFVGKAILAGSFDKVADRFAREIAAREPRALVDSFRVLAGKQFAPPGVGPIAPLTDLLVHTRDLERPLGLASTLDMQGMHTVLNYVCGGKARGFVPVKRTSGLRFVATDSDWSIGSGLIVTGTGEAIMLATTNRSIALADLSGDGLTSFATRLN